jgi:hypothetical protein
MSNSNQDNARLSCPKEDNIVPKLGTPSKASVPVIVEPVAEAVTKIYDLDLQNRRLVMLKLDATGNLGSVSIKRLAQSLTAQYQAAGVNRKVTAAALWKDWQRHRQWEDAVWASKDANDEGKKLLRMLWFAIQKALALMDGADNDSAKVGAIRVYLDAIRLAVMLAQSLGMLPRVNMETVKVDVNVAESRADGIRKLAEYVSIIAEAAASDGHIQNVRVGKQVDSQQASSGDGQKRSDAQTS